eukprot:CAMPEP_0181396440 /NCGR_PEP_ID=MMETSP1106-20121128/28872_1 /TAXON_ID=81844 /ORGANISM="Mantoniella antarctica, Strain SL-175" /LENGTH=201 /DNA_ID=CAMNT_0023518123 /DNA_START=15 /DNA_END=617 /DNA_ORIENTATION=+
MMESTHHDPNETKAVEDGKGAHVHQALEHISGEASSGVEAGNDFNIARRDSTLELLRRKAAASLALKAKATSVTPVGIGDSVGAVTRVRWTREEGSELEGYGQDMYRREWESQEGAATAIVTESDEMEEALRLQSLERFVRRLDTKDRTASPAYRAQVEAARCRSVCGTGVAVRKVLGAASREKMERTERGNAAAAAAVAA